MRREFVEGLHARGVNRDFSCLQDQNGMFSYTGLTKEQVARLRSEHSIYIVDSGRINVAGLTSKNLPLVCEAIATVL
jgi:aspartate/tyrosine/aromatic aminotransferase